ncbi:Transcriptional regulator, MarR family [Candidatus Burkholderia verschuerenii]|uniref:Transcriptional regulator, MarR family n=2 Tax=Candidatus Burkholderia verschuerenii TaxID=242163 RepID=A0A0L0M9B4_9BURK|nr:Transcriptional regulator, MarR family [Candidatus Burkholderia verschuerenii]
MVVRRRSRLRDIEGFKARQPLLQQIKLGPGVVITEKYSTHGCRLLTIGRYPLPPVEMAQHPCPAAQACAPILKRFHKTPLQASKLAATILPSQLLQSHDYSEMSDASKAAPAAITLDNYVLSESVGYLISRVRSTMWNMVTQQTTSELGITSTQASIMFMLAVGKCATAADIAREYGIDASAVTRLIDRLEKRGLLSRVRSEADRRVVRLALTDDGRAMAEKVPPIFTSVLDKLLTGFSPEEVGFLKNMLRRILANSCDPSAAALLAGADKSGT